MSFEQIIRENVFIDSNDENRYKTWIKYMLRFPMDADSFQRALNWAKTYDAEFVPCYYSGGNAEHLTGIDISTAEEVKDYVLSLEKLEEQVNKRNKKRISELEKEAEDLGFEIIRKSNI